MSVPARVIDLNRDPLSRCRCLRPEPGAFVRTHLGRKVRTPTSGFDRPARAGHYKRFLLDVLQVELADRDLRRQQRLLRLARFPRPKRLEDFDFAKNPNVAPEVVADLKTPTWVREGRPLVLIGDSGTGKSHLLIGIGTAIAETGLSVRYTTTSALVNELAEADANRRLSSVIARYGKIDLLFLDEFGYLGLDRKGAKLLFQIFIEREERKATAVARNSPFTEWDRTFGDARPCAALSDRITFRCTLIQTGTESYRYQATQESLFPPN
ncbi:IS21-like element helper ATPase IstB [Streptomyces sp. NPDC054835]